MTYIIFIIISLSILIEIKFQPRLEIVNEKGEYTSILLFYTVKSPNNFTQREYFKLIQF